MPGSSEGRHRRFADEPKLYCLVWLCRCRVKAKALVEAAEQIGAKAMVRSAPARLDLYVGPRWVVTVRGLMEDEYDHLLAIAELIHL